MKKISSITIFGFLVFIVSSPFFAIPQVWKNFFLMLTGLIIVILSIFLRKELYKILRIINRKEEIISDTYVENNPQ